MLLFVLITLLFAFQAIDLRSYSALSLNQSDFFRPTGIVDLGFQKPLNTSSLMCNITVYTLDIGLDFASSTNLTVTGSGKASIQLDAVLRMSKDWYYLQNELALSENTQGEFNASFLVSVWNLSSKRSTFSPQFSEPSATIVSTPNGSVLVYALNVPFLVRVPFSFEPMIFVVANQGQITIHFYDYLLQQHFSPFFNDYQISLKGSQASLVTGGRNPVNYNLYQCVFGGAFDHGVTQITSLDSQMLLYYLNGSSYSAVPEAVAYGYDSAEGVGGVAAFPVFINGVPQVILSTELKGVINLWPISNYFVKLNISKSSFLLIANSKFWVPQGIVELPALLGKAVFSLPLTIEPFNKTMFELIAPQVLQINSTARAVLSSIEVNGLPTNNSRISGYVFAPISFFFSYTMQYYVSVLGPNISIQGFYDAGTTLKADAPPRLGNPITPMSFYGWIGTFNITSVSLRVTVEQPIHEVAYYKQSYLNLYILIVLIALITLVTAVTIKRDL